MKKLALLLASFAFVPAGFAADQPASSSKDPMAGWVPRKITKEQQDKKEIAALFKAMHEAGKNGDLNAAAALVDYPVLMVTDDSKGEATADVTVAVPEAPLHAGQQPGSSSTIHGRCARVNTASMRCR